MAKVSEMIEFLKNRYSPDDEIQILYWDKEWLQDKLEYEVDESMLPVSDELANEILAKAEGYLNWDTEDIEMELTEFAVEMVKENN